MPTRTTLADPGARREAAAPVRRTDVAQALAWAALLLALLNVAARDQHAGLDLRLFDADNLFLPALYRDLAVDGGRWAGWRLTPAPSFFPDMLLFFLLNAGLGSFLYAIAAYAVVQVGLFVAACIALANAVCRPRRAAGRALVLTVVAALILAYGQGRLPLLSCLFGNQRHGGTLILSLVCAALLVLAQPGGRRAPLAAVGTLGLLGGLSDTLFLVTFSLPAAAALAWLGRRERRPVASLAIALAVLLAPPILGWRLARLLTHGAAGAGYMHLQIPAAIQSSLQFARDVLALCDSRTGPVLLLYLVALAATAAMAWRSARRLTGPSAEGSGAALWFLYATLATAATVAAPLLGGLFIDRECFRYLAAATVLPFLSVALLGARALPAPAARWALRLGPAVACAAAGLCLARAPWRAPSLDLLHYYPPLAACLDENRARYGLRGGVSDYWNAKPVSLFSRTGLRVRQLDGSGNPFHWISNEDWYLDDRFAREPYDFAVMDGLDARLFRQRYGEPDATFRCAGSEIFVYAADGPFDGKLRESLRTALARH